ncbi:MarR family transcriptional regulator [Agrococcus versicolor]|uniref:MarR family transcriptional regulator n=1 Tax=Agrococcus versicolor TaxID=501482 RepID=A0ABN3AMP4_9MICO
MERTEQGVDLPTSVGYLLKEVATALRAEMERVLRPLSMTVTHYSCLELLAQRPGASSSQLARGTFVTRQSMHVLLQTLEREGHVVRATEPGGGRAMPVEITAEGRRRLAVASAAVRSVEARMLDGLGDDEATLRALLQRCRASLRG